MSFGISKRDWAWLRRIAAKEGQEQSDCRETKAHRSKRDYFSLKGIKIGRTVVIRECDAKPHLDDWSASELAEKVLEAIG